MPIFRIKNWSAHAVSAFSQLDRRKGPPHHWIMNLLVLAAGVGSRFGGIKQLIEVGSYGETLLEYSLFDAYRARFDRIVFIIRPEIEADFRASILARLPRWFSFSWVYQTRESLLDESQKAQVSAAGRMKPWGTGHALLCAKDQLGNAPFAVMNADDYYGRTAFEAISVHLSRCPEEFCGAMYRLDDVVPIQGSVSRAICEVDAKGYLERIDEHTKIWRSEGRFLSERAKGIVELPADTPVSMNLWGLNASVFEYGNRAWQKFLADSGNYGRREFYLPDIVRVIMSEHDLRVHALPASVQSFGLTNPEDLAETRRRISSLIKSGFYPSPLWEDP